MLTRASTLCWMIRLQHSLGTNTPWTYASIHPMPLLNDFTRLQTIFYFSNREIPQWLINPKPIKRLNASNRAQKKENHYTSRQLKEAWVISSQPPLTTYLHREWSTPSLKRKHPHAFKISPWAEAFRMVYPVKTLFQRRQAQLIDKTVQRSITATTEPYRGWELGDKEAPRKLNRLKLTRIPVPPHWMVYPVKTLFRGDKLQLNWSIKLYRGA